jgi:hypothetical protein
MKIMAMRRRKTLVVGQACHANIHTGLDQVVTGEPDDQETDTSGSGGGRWKGFNSTSPTSYLARQLIARHWT